MAKHIKTVTVTTRKEHKCFGCNKIIPIGTKQVVDTCEDEGRIYDVRLCPVCDMLSDEYEKHDDEWYQGDLGEEPYWSQARERLEAKGSAKC